MTIKEIFEQEDLTKVIEDLQVKNPDIKVNYQDAAKDFDVLQHDVFDTSIRQKKQIKKPTGQTDINGNTVYDTIEIDVARLAVPFEKLIINRLVSFMLTNKIQIIDDAETDKEKLLVEIVNQIGKDNKLDYKTKQLARIVMSECEAAELWYLVDDTTGFWNRAWNTVKKTLNIPANSGKKRAKMKILANSLGDTLYPHFDDNRDMDAFSRSYVVIEKDGTAVEKFETYTSDYIYYFIKENSDWVYEMPPVKNVIGKIPVVYISQPYPEWWDVRPLRKRYETMISNFADSNDYFGSPIIKVKGTVKGFATKGEAGKIIEMEENADAEYLTWDQAPEAIKLEEATVRDLIFICTQTPDISFQKMVGLTNPSGIAMELMFLDAHLKVWDKVEIFGEAVQRRLNLLKAIARVINVISDEAMSVNMEPEFTPYMPKNIGERITNLSTAVGGKPIMSQKRAVEMNPFIEPGTSEDELEEMEKDKVEDFGESFDVTNSTNKNKTKEDAAIGNEAAA